MKKEFLQSISLETYINNYPLNLENFLDIAIELCKSVETFHKKNITIGTLSTSCILISMQKETHNILFLEIDHNYAKSQSERIYRAPEQDERLHLHLDHSIDIYILGIIFYQMLVSKKSKEKNQTAQNFLYAHVNKELPSLHEVDASLPLALCNIITKMTCKDPDERYSDILSVYADLAKSLQQFKQKGVIEAFELNSFKSFVHFKRTALFCGREAPLQEIHTLMKEKNPRNILVGIYGNSGVGKSFFINKVLNDNAEYFSHILKLKLEKYHQNAPYEILYDALRNFIKQILTKDEKVLTHYKAELQGVLGSQAQILIDVLPELEVILGKQAEVNDIGLVDKKARFDSMLFRVMELFFHSEKLFCIYIDDLQWADEIIMEWIQNILLKLNNMILFTSYRDEDIAQEHQIKQMFEKCSSFDVKTKEIELRGLHKDDIKELLQNAMQLEQADEVAEILLQKTDGNAFFVNEYIQQFQKDGTIVFDYETLEWSCDVQKLHKTFISDNLFEVLNKKIQLLDTHVRTLLNIASCLGSNFTCETLQSVYKNDALFFIALDAAIEDEWIIPDIENEQKKYYFSHDKMQEAIYSKLDDETLQQIHYKIGIHILHSSKKLENRVLIRCVNHLNIGYKLFSDIQTLIDLNVRASRHSKKSGDFTHALIYIKKAMDLISQETLSITGLELLKDRAECEHLCHNSQKAVHYYELALSKCQTKIQKAHIYELLIKFYSDISDFQKAYETGRYATKLFGYSMPKSFSSPQFLFDFINLKVKLGAREIEKLSALEDAQDEEFIYLVKLASNSLQAAYQIRPELCVANAIRIITLCLQKGLTKESVIAFTVFGVIFQGGILGNHSKGFEYYRLSMDVLKRFKNTTQHAEVKFVSGYFATSWIEAAIETEKLWQEAYQNGLEIGDWFHTGCAAAAMAQSMFMRGANLDLLLEQIEEFLVVLQNIGTMEQHGALLSIKHSILNLQGKTFSPLSLSTEVFDEASYKASLHQYTSKHFAHYYYINKLSLFYMHKEYKKALEISEEGKRFASDSKGMLHNTEHTFYEALTVAKLYEDENLYLKMKYKSVLKKAKRSFYNYAKDSMENFIARAYLLEGELYRIQGDTSKAIQLYEKSLDAATIYMQFNLVALANKLIKEIYEQKSQNKAAGLYEKAYMQSLVSWGVQKEDFKDEIAKFDFAALLEASEIIVKEQRLSNLLEALVQTILTNSGAQNVFLLLKEENQLFIEAEYLTQGTMTKVMHHQPFVESKKIVHSIVNYVLRTQKSIVISDLDKSEIFSNSNNTETEKKSILCAPLILKREIKGIVYLENNLLSGVFTEEKVKLLQYLSGQIAISIENALVYNNLEKAVAARTQELEIANRKLEKLSTIDPLTKISNRRHFETHMEDIWGLSVRTSVPVSIIMCDIDYFKKINDTYGHTIGDVVLQNIALIIQNSLKRSTDLAARYGGEEFIIALYDTETSGAKKVCQSIADRLKEDERIFFVEGVKIEPFTISFGVSTLVPKEGDNYQALIAKADKSLYRAKSNGRNCIVTD